MEQHKVETHKKAKVYRAREARLTIDCSLEQKKKIKMLAASNLLSAPFAPPIFSIFCLHF